MTESPRFRTIESRKAQLKGAEKSRDQIMFKMSHSYGDPEKYDGLQAIYAALSKEITDLRGLLKA